MAPSYYSTSSTRDHFIEPPSLFARLLSTLPPGLAVVMQRLWNDRSYTAVSTSASRIPRSLRQLERSWHPRRLLNLPHLFILIWVFVLLWGERWVFQSTVKECQWENWERWPKDATPHHLVFLADPQIIDPHTYPERPWPLDKLTMLHTDNYMKKSYISLQKRLHPDTIFFLGDLFDGGREWKTAHGNTADPSWANGQRPSGEQAYVDTWGKRYGEDFWLHEYDRFGRIFYKFWNLAGADPGPWQRGRKIISTLPGNHDLGFGQNIKLPIRNRFEVYFGEGNRVDVIGNHTFVSIDAVSLSATGAEHENKEITQPVQDFLANVQSTKRKAVARELSLQAGEEKVLQYRHKVEDVEKANFKNLPTLDPGPGNAEFPTILLTHVPLYREPGTPCGPQRERWPPTKPPKHQLSPVFPDHRNAISISKGYQYQNVLSEDDSVKVVSSIGNVDLVFSGDDHDYCEVVHPENKNHAREITVKSTSYAMGVRKPGFLLLSMWNPVGPDGKPLSSTPPGHGTAAQTSPTTESHLCLLPDQLGILIRYGIFIGVTIFILIVRAFLTPILRLAPFSPLTSTSTSSDDISLLPTTKSDLRRTPSPTEPHSNFNSSSSSNNLPSVSNLAPRSSAARTRSVSPAKGYGLPANSVRFATPPLINTAGYTPSYYPPADDFGKPRGDRVERDRKPLGFWGTVWRETWTSVWRTAWCVVLVYLYLTKWG